MTEHDPGRLDRVAEFDAHATSYHRFSLLVKWTMLSAATLISFLVLTFASQAGVAGGLVTGAVVFIIGVYALRHGWAHSSERDSGAPTAS